LTIVKWTDLQLPPSSCSSRFNRSGLLEASPLPVHVRAEHPDAVAGLQRETSMSKREKKQLCRDRYEYKTIV
jgi:hypothetical protein